MLALTKYLGICFRCSKVEGRGDQLSLSNAEHLPSFFALTYSFRFRKWSVWCAHKSETAPLIRSFCSRFASVSTCRQGSNRQTFEVIWSYVAVLRSESAQTWQSLADKTYLHSTLRSVREAVWLLRFAARGCHCHAQNTSQIRFHSLSLFSLFCVLLRWRGLQGQVRKENVDDRLCFPNVG